MWDHLVLFAPVFGRLAFIMFKVAIDYMAATWPALYMLTPLDSFSNLPLQINCILTIFNFIFCYTNTGAKMIKLSSQFGLLLLAVNTAIHHVLILPLVGHFKDKSFAFTFASQNELMTQSGNTIVCFLDSAHLTCPTHACGK
ncbi:hypothetical protein DSO57_1006477 [Entomophthora muscae]|uniref:Uncharacterized protein n=1 Tax=Entomophthora muscae TaxID=34485 RepID=A0ACC2RM98_9FUNG|nr:hypothetical protein DSO57_1006477 [Entomophthora muscae]